MLAFGSGIFVNTDVFDPDPYYRHIEKHAEKRSEAVDFRVTLHPGISGRIVYVRLSNLYRRT